MSSGRRRGGIAPVAASGPSLAPAWRREFLFTSFEGFVIPYFAVPNLGRSVHTLSAFMGVLLVALGLLWPRLDLGATAARTAFWLLIYSALVTIMSFLLAALWGLKVAPACIARRQRNEGIAGACGVTRDLSRDSGAPSAAMG